MTPQRRRYNWRIREEGITLGARTLIMGVLSLDADAGSAKKLDPGAMLEQAQAMEEQGADFIEVHAGPLQPGTGRVTSDDELPRLVPVLRKLHFNLDVPISINTYNAATVERALELGVHIVNDVSGLAFDPRLAEVVNRSDAGLILTHLRGTPDTWKNLRPVPYLVSTVCRELESSLARARGAGIDRRRIVVDPGLELGKRGLENYLLLTQLERLGALQQPVLVSPSRKHFLTETIRASEDNWLHAACAAATLAICGGAHILRVHEVAAIAQVARTTDHIYELDG
jgi:dihydropteroate synthase